MNISWFLGKVSLKFSTRPKNNFTEAIRGRKLFVYGYQEYYNLGPFVVNKLRNRIPMNRNITLWIRTLLALVLVFNLVVLFPVRGDEKIQSTDEFIERLEDEYRKIDDFSARVRISGLEPPLRVKLLAVSEPRILRVEYLSPPEMEGQFFLLKGDFLYQFMPAQNLIIKKDLKKSNIPVKTANLTPDYLLKMVRSEELEVNLIGSPEEVYYPWKGKNIFKLDVSVPWLNDEDSSKTRDDPSSTTPASFGSKSDNYVLEVIPRVKGYQFARQVIKFDKDSLLPRELISYFDGEKKEPVRTEVKEVEINHGLEQEKITSRPKDAEVILD